MHYGPLQLVNPLTQPKTELGMAATRGCGNWRFVQGPAVTDNKWECRDFEVRDVSRRQAMHVLWWDNLGPAHCSDAV